MNRDFVLIALTQRYGYIAEGRAAAPDKELRYIMQVRDTCGFRMIVNAIPDEHERGFPTDAEHRFRSS